MSRRLATVAVIAACGGSDAASSREGEVGSCKVLSCRDIDCSPQLGAAATHDSDALLGFDIHPGIGNLHLAEDDAAARPAIGAALGVERHYNSLADAANHGFGPGWSHTYGWRLGLVDATTARVVTASGRAIVFSGGPAWVPPVGERGTLTGSTATGFTYTAAHGTRLTFDGGGRLIEIREAAAPVPVTIQYAGGDTIATVASGVGYGTGATLTFSYTGDRITAIADPAGHVWKYDYDASGRLVLVTLPNGGQTRYTWDATGITRISRATAPGVWVDRGLFAYDDRGQVAHAASSAIGGAQQNEVSLAYALCLDAPSITTATLAGGTKTIQTERIGGVQRPTRITATAGIGARGESADATWQWNADLTLASVSSGGITTQYSDYDARGNARTIVEGAGTPVARTTRYTYHPVLGTVTSASWPSVDGASTHVVIADYDADYDNDYNRKPTPILHQLIEQGMTDTGLTGAAGTAVTLVTRVDVDALNRATRVTYPNGKTVQYDYFAPSADATAQYRLAARTLRTSGDRSLVERVTGYDAIGQIVQQIDAHGVATAYEYDELGEVLTQTVASRTDRYSYNLAGQLTSEETAGGRRVVHEYDAAGRRWRKRSEMADGSVASTEVAALDDRGRVRALRRFAGGGEQTAPTCGAGEQAELCEAFTYDAFGRRASMSTLSSADEPCAGEACRVTYSYDANGNLACTTEAGQTTTCYERDGRARLSGIKLPNGTRVTFRYDANDQLIERRDPKDRAFAFVWDDFGRELSRTTPDAGRFVANYDAGGLRTSTLDARGVRIDTSYDLAGRPVAYTVPSDPSGNSNIAYVYDEASYAFSAGRLTSIIAHASDGTLVASHRSYDERGHVVDQVEERGGAVTRQHYALGTDGEPLATTYPDGKVVTFQHPTGGAAFAAQPESATVDFGGSAHALFSDAAYTTDGRLASLVDAAGGVRIATRNKRGELVRLVAGPLLDPWVDERYEYDADGRGRVAAVHHFAGNYNAYDETYTTDEHGRITSTTTNVGGAPVTTAWTYDAVGNRLSEMRNGALTRYNYADPANNRLTSRTAPDGSPSDEYAYDQAGYLASHTARERRFSYSYDPFSRLRQVQEETSAAGTSSLPSSITFSYLATSCGGGDIVFSINGTVAARAAANAGCTCAPGVQSIVVTDPAILGLLTTGSNRFTVEFPQYLAWAVATVNGNDFVIYDAGGGGDALARNADLCAAGYSYATPAQTLAQPSLGSVTFTYLATSCGGSQSVAFTINGATVLTRGVAPACTCSPGIATVKTSDAAVLGALHSGVNTLGVNFPGYLAWATVGVEGQSEVAVYDPAGHAAARDPDLCSGAYGYNVSASAPTASYEPRSRETFTYDGYGRIWERRLADGRYTQTYYDASGRVSEEIEYRGERAYGAPVTYVIDHVRAGGSQIAQVVQICRKPNKLWPIACSDFDLRAVAEGLHGPMAIESALNGTPTWNAVADAMGAWLGMGQLRGGDGQPGTKDDLAMKFANGTGMDLTRHDPLDDLVTGMGHGSRFKQSITDRLGGPQLDTGWDGGSYAPNLVADGLAMLGAVRVDGKGNGPPTPYKDDPSWYGMHDGKLDEDDDPPSDPPMVTADGKVFDHGWQSDAPKKTDLEPHDTPIPPAVPDKGGGNNGGNSGGKDGGVDVGPIIQNTGENLGLGQGVINALKEIKEHGTATGGVQDHTNPNGDVGAPGTKKMCADTMECGDDTTATVPSGPLAQIFFKKDGISHPVNPGTIDSSAPLGILDEKAHPGNIDPVPPDETGGGVSQPPTIPEDATCAVTHKCGYK
jgi:YD repeat-containing protein